MHRSACQPYRLTPPSKTHPIQPVRPQLGGAISEERQGRFGSAKSVPQICSALKKAAYDPRVSGVFIKARAHLDAAD